MERIHVVSSAAKNPSIIRRSFRRTIFFIIAILAIGSTFEPYNQAQLAVVLIYFIGVLSVTILTGISGQISLGQGALMAVGDISGAVTLVKLCPELVNPANGEKNAVGAILDRESRREKNLEAIKKQQAILKAQVKPPPLPPAPFVMDAEKENQWLKDLGLAGN